MAVTALKDAPVQAHVVLKRAEDDAGSRRINAPNRSVREEVRRELEGLGFTIVRVSPLSILIEATPETFRNVFHAHAQVQESGSQDHWPQRHLTWAAEPQIPAPLRSTVENIVLPQPVQLH